MVSLWPWKSDDSSPASFEKILSALSTKISKSQQQLDTLRQRSRRFKALWTLYTSFIYLLCAIILALVVGWKNWSALEYSALAGSPLVIYLVRTVITVYYTYRIDTISYRLDQQQVERAKTIDKLKAATKYNSTQQLLEKYGGAPPQPSPKPRGQSNPARTPRKPSKQLQRTNIGPPATANIPSNRPLGPNEPPSYPSPSNILPGRLPPSLPNSPLSGSQAGPPEFAPNAFGSVPLYDRTLESNADGKWYDRILDLLLGEDETSPKNRIVLICEHCRLVNGQAPPGIKNVRELGKWRCIGCGGWNGEVDEGAKIVEEMNEKVEIEVQDQLEKTYDDGKDNQDLSEDVTKDLEERTLEEEEYSEVEEVVEKDSQPAKQTRSERQKHGARGKS